MATLPEPQPKATSPAKQLSPTATDPSPTTLVATPQGELEHLDRKQLKKLQSALDGAPAGHWRDLKTLFELTGIFPPKDNASPKDACHGERFSHPSRRALQSKGAEIHTADADMADETPATPPVSPVPPEQCAAPQQPIPFDIGEEFGTAKRNLPPAKIVAIVLGVAAVIVATFAFVQRAKPQGGGSIDNISAVEIPDQNAVLVAVNVTIHNSAERPLWIHTIKATLKTDSGEFSDDAASSSDFARYFQAFPALKEHALSIALVPEQKIQPGAQAQGTIVVSFPVTQDAFDKRKSLSVSIQPYDQPAAVVLTK